jgi:pilus assembly protein CpaF
MVTLTITEKGGKAAAREFDKPEITIGRIQGNDIVLPKSNISKRHARIIQNGDSFVIIDSKSTNGTYINGKRIDAPYDLQAGDKIFVGDFTIEIQVDEEEEASVSRGRGRDADDEDEEEDEAPPPPKRREEKREAKARDDSNGRAEPAAKKGKEKRSSDDVLPDEDWDANEGLEGDWADDWDASQSKAKPERGEKRDESRREAKPKRREESAIEDKPKVKKEEKAPAPKREESRPEAPPPKRAPREPSAAGELGDDASQALRVVHERLLRSLDLRRLGVETMDEEELRTRTRTSVEEIVTSMKEAGELPASVEPKSLIDDVLDEALGMGPLEDLLHDESVDEIMVNGAAQIFVERDGKISRVDRSFSSDQAVIGVIERMLAPLGRHIDDGSPMVDARLKNGARLNAVVPPLAVNGPTLIIRKQTREPLLVDDLVASGTLTAAMATFLETCVKARKNVVISGPTNAGKTALLNVLATFVQDGERVVAIEESAELKIEGHVVRLEARPPNSEGRGAVSTRDLLRNALRMFPQRVILGDCRGGEALELLQGMASGYEGALTTLHAGSPADALSRLETMMLMGGVDIAARAIREQIASSVDIVVQLARLSDGSRRVTHISEVTGMENGVISMHDIFVFEQQGLAADGRVMGVAKPTGYVPKFYEELPARGIKTDFEIFQT